jgi:hypothetical protein
MDISDIEVLCHIYTGISSMVFVNRHIQYKSLLQSIKNPFPLPKNGEEFFTIGYPVTKDESPIYKKRYLEKGKNYSYTTTHFHKVGEVNVPYVVTHEGVDWEKVSKTHKKWNHTNFELLFKEFNGRKKFDCELKRSDCGNVKVSIMGKLKWKFNIPTAIDFKDLNLEKKGIGNYDKLRIQECSIKGNGKYPIIINCQYDKTLNKFQTNSIFLNSLTSFARKRTPWMRTSISALYLGVVGSSLFILKRFGIIN